MTRLKSVLTSLLNPSTWTTESGVPRHDEGSQVLTADDGEGIRGDTSTFKTGKSLHDIEFCIVGEVGKGVVEEGVKFRLCTGGCIGTGSSNTHTLVFGIYSCQSHPLLHHRCRVQ